MLAETITLEEFKTQFNKGSETAIKTPIICPVVEIAEKVRNGGLTDKEIEDGYFIDVVLGKCNIKKAMQQRAEAIRREYEAFDNMHRADGIVDNKCLRIL